MAKPGKSKIPTDVKSLLRACEDAGATIERGKGGHWKVYVDGRMVASIAATTSDHRSIKNTISDMRKNGLDLT